MRIPSSFHRNLPGRSKPRNDPVPGLQDSNFESWRPGQTVSVSEAKSSAMAARWSAVRVVSALIPGWSTPNAAGTLPPRGNFTYCTEERRSMPLLAGSNAAPMRVPFPRRVWAVHLAQLALKAGIEDPFGVASRDLPYVSVIVANGQFPRSKVWRRCQISGKSRFVIARCFA
jgi:hypothetical protein